VKTPPPRPRDPALEDDRDPAIVAAQRRRERLLAELDRTKEQLRLASRELARTKAQRAAAWSTTGFRAERAVPSGSRAALVHASLLGRSRATIPDPPGRDLTRGPGGPPIGPRSAQASAPDRPVGIEARVVLALSQLDRAVVIYRDQAEPLTAIEHYLALPVERAPLAAVGRRAVLARHTFDDRVEAITCALGGRP